MERRLSASVKNYGHTLNLKVNSTDLNLFMKSVRQFQTDGV